ncbi:MAG TPA: PAS domain-containing protein [Gemmatimonadales bacterium]|nr:PAS domain-containing protein [Gemmatimonadales bacterium]
MTTHIAASFAPPRLDDMLERLGDAFLAFDADWRCTYANRAAIRLLSERYGAASGDPTGRVIWDRVPGLAGTALETALRRAAAARVPVSSSELDAPRGRVLEARIFPSDDGVSALIRELTGIESIPPDDPASGHARDALEGISELFCHWDDEWRITYCNRRGEAYLRHLGKDPDGMLGRPVWDAMPELAGTSFHAAALRAAAERREVTVEDWFRPPGVDQCFAVRFVPVAGGMNCYARDVTLRRRAQAGMAETRRLLRESEERFRLLVESIDDVVFRLDRDGRCVDIFGRWLEREGSPAQMLLGRTTGEIVGPATAPMHEEANRRALAGETVVYEWELVRKRGNRHMQASLAPLRNAAGEVIGIVGVNRDLTSRVESEREIQRLNADLERQVAELQRRETHQRLLADTSRLLDGSREPEAALAAVARATIPALADFTILDVFDDDGRLERLQLAHAEPAVEARLAADARTCTPDPAWDDHPIVQVLRTGAPLLMPDLSESEVAALGRRECDAAFLAALAPRSLMVVPLRAHGQSIGKLTFGYSASGRRHTPEDLALAEEVAGRAALAAENARLFQAAQREVRRRTEAESTASRWAFIFERAAWGVSIASPDAQRIEAVNPAFARLHGYASSELQGRPLADLVAPHRRAECATQMARAREQGHQIWESEHLRHDGSGFPVLVDVAAIRGGGELLCLAATVQDLTERKRAEEQVRQAQKMDAVGRLAGGVAHDFNNMLMIILGFCDLLVESLDRDDARRADALEIRKAADRASALTRQLLTLGHPQILKRQVMNLNEVIRELDPMLRPLIREDIRLVESLSAGLGGVAADRGQLEQIVMNLALNARDAMAHGGRLTIETINVDLPEGYAYRHIGIDIPAGPYVMLVVSDTGRGIDPRVKARLFEPFFTTKTSGRNTGLGLATVYSIVTQTGGYVWVDSEPGEGAAFKICLPRIEPASDAAEPVTPECRPIRGGAECLLVVEDEDAVRSLAGRVLAGLGYLVLEAANGREALEIAREYPGSIDLLVTDVVMPEMGGLDLIDALLALRPGIGVVVMSGYMEPDHARGTLRDAGIPFLPKPFSPDGLSRQVRDVLDARAAGVTHHSPS